jgi:hypothetical protein
MTQPLQNDASGGPKIPPDKRVDILLRLASAARIRRSSDGRLHAQVPVDDRHETYGLKSAGMRNWLTDAYFNECGQPPSLWAIQRVISVLEAKAWFDRGMPSASIRVARDPAAGDAAHYIDLGDSTGSAIWVSSEGWTVVEKPDVHFWRPDGLLALPEPSRDGSIELLRQYVNVSDADSQLLNAWITAAMRPVGPCPILVLHGEQGSGKSTLARLLQLLVDPQACPLLAEPRSTRDLMVTALNGWLLAFDNVSRISNELSDAFCRLATGGATSDRRLRTNDERHIIYAQRPVILNGIDEFVLRADLIDRCIFLYLRAILPANRRAEDRFWKGFYADYPRILGGFLNAVAGGLRELPSVRVPELPRMADFAQWGEAVGRALGWEPGSFLFSYASNRQEATATALNDSLLANVLDTMGPRLQVDRWQGKNPAELYFRLTEFAEFLYGEHFPPSDDRTELRKRRAAFAAQWPKDARTFAKELRRIAPQLRLHGLSIDFERGHSGRHVVFKHTHPIPGLDDDY